MKAKLLKPIASIHGKIAKGYYARLLNVNQIIQRCPMRKKPLTPAQLRAQQEFAQRYAARSSRPP
jgi:hypothetical protein